MAFHPFSIVGLFFILSSIILSIFSNIGQTKLETIPYKLRFVSLDVSKFGVGIAASLGQEGNATALYVRGGDIPTGNAVGIAIRYEWGLWNHCAYINASLPLNRRGYCRGTRFGSTFKPYPTLLNDVPPQFSDTVQAVIPNSTLTSTSYLERLSQAAFYFIFVGIIFAGIPLILGLASHRYLYLLCAGFALGAGLFQAIGAIIWTVIISKLRKDVNDLVVPNALIEENIPLGIEFAYGNALWLLWASVGGLLSSILPFFLAFCTGRNKTNYE